MGGATLGACASGIAGYGGTAGHCPPLAPNARNGASPHHAGGPLVSTSAAAARCLPLLPLPAVASRVASATSPRASPEYAAAVCRVAKATSQGWGPKTGRCQGNHSRRAYTPSCCPPQHFPTSTLPSAFPPVPRSHTLNCPYCLPTAPPPLPAAGIPPRNAPPPPGPPAGKTRRGSSLG